MKNPIRILHLEDNKNDVELVKEILLLEKLDVEVFSVDNQKDFENALKNLKVDLILADYSLPSFDGLSALKLVRDFGYTIPFIIVSAVLGEELAIEALHSGATDYVLKSRMQRLIPAIKRAMREIEERDKRVKLEKEISELEELYQKIAERVRGFLKMDLPSERFSLVDKFIEELSGYNSVEWYNTPNFIQTIIHPDFKEYYDENFKSMKEGFIPKIMEYKIIRKYGEERWWLQFNIGAYDFDQKLVSVSIVIIDNTETKESLIKYQNLYENALVGMFRTSIETGKIIEANEMLANIFGYTIEELEQLFSIDFYPNETIQRELLKELHLKGSVKGYQYQLLNKNNEVIWVSLSARIYPSEGFIEGVMIDISNQKKAQQELFEREQELENIFAHKGTGTIIIDENMTITKCNNQVEFMTGFSKEEIEGKKKWTEFVHQDDLERLTSYHLLRRKENSDVPLSYRCKVVDRYGKIIDIHLMVGLMPGTTKSIASMLDITQMKEAETALIRDRAIFKIIAEATVQSIDMRDMCQQVLIGLVENLGFDSGSIRIYYENERLLLTMADYGLSSDIKQFLSYISIGNTELPLTQFLTKIIFAPDASSHDLLKDTDLVTKYKYKSYISWPIFNANKKFLGSIQIGSFKQKKSLTEGDRSFFESISGIFATAVERKMANEALKESESQYRKLVESLPNQLGLLIIQNNQIKFVSPTIFEMFKIASVKEVINTDPIQFFSSNEYVRVDKHLNSLTHESSDNTTILSEVNLKRMNNEEFPADVFLSLTSYQGEPAIQFLVWEITERKKSEKIIRESEEKYRGLVETSPYAITLTDITGKLVFINRQAFMMFNAEDEKFFLGKSVCSLVVDYQREFMQSLLGTLLKEENIRNIELTFLRSDHSTFQGELSSTIINDQNDKPNAILSVMQDISKRKEIELHTRMLVNIIENSKEVVITADATGKIIYANAPIEDVFGYTPEEIIGKDISILAPPGGEELQSNLFQSTLNAGKTTFESVRKHKNGSLIPAIITLVAIRDLERDQITINAIIVDLSNLKKLEASLKDRSFELETLNKIISAGYIARNINELLDFTLTTILNSLDYNGGAFYLINQKTQQVEFSEH